MIAAPQQRSGSPFSYQPSPLTVSLVLGEHRAATQNQTVPASPSLSPLAVQARQRTTNTLSVVSGLNRTPGARNSPSPAVVPDCGGSVFSGSPLLRQILTVGRKRQHDSSPDTPTGSQANLSPIATSRKRFCKHCSNVYEEVGGNSMVILNRREATKTRKAVSSARSEQVVPDYDPQLKENRIDDHETKATFSTNKDGIKLFQLFTGDANDIFAHHEE